MARVNATASLQALLERQSEPTAFASPFSGRYSIADVVTIADSVQALAHTASQPFKVEVAPNRIVIRSKSAAAARLVECLPSCMELIRTHRGDQRYLPIAATFFEQFERRLSFAIAPYGSTVLGNVYVLCDCLNGAIAATREIVRGSAFVLRAHRHKEQYDRRKQEAATYLRLKTSRRKGGLDLLNINLYRGDGRLLTASREELALRYSALLRQCREWIREVAKRFGTALALNMYRGECAEADAYRAHVLLGFDDIDASELPNVFMSLQEAWRADCSAAGLHGFIVNCAVPGSGYAYRATDPESLPVEISEQLHRHLVYMVDTDRTCAVHLPGAIPSFGFGV